MNQGDAHLHRCRGAHRLGVSDPGFSTCRRRALRLGRYRSLMRPVVTGGAVMRQRQHVFLTCGLAAVLVAAALGQPGGPPARGKGTAVTPALAVYYQLYLGDPVLVAELKLDSEQASKARTFSSA